MFKKKVFILGMLAVLAITLMANTALAKRFYLGDSPLDLVGQFSQGVAYGLNDGFDTYKGFNQMVGTFLLDATYLPSDKVKFFSQLALTRDLIYDIKGSDDEWKRKGFDKSSDYLGFDNQYWQIIKEAHLTYTPGDFLFRFGKQIISWGQTDAFRLMDQINPSDGRRGFADVAYETTIIPIWLVRADYSHKVNSTWLQDLGFQFWFNPNADFIGNQNPQVGNNQGGIWSPNISLGPDTYLGSLDLDLKKPANWDSNYFEYGVRIQAMIADTLVTLNGFYGRDNDYVAQTLPIFPRVEIVDGKTIIHPALKGYYPYQRFVGGTLSRDLASWRFLPGGVSPVLRFEGFYGFKTTFATDAGTLVESDEIRAALGLDWKIKVPFLNPESGISFSSQVYYRRIMDYPGLTPVSGYKQDNWITTLSLSSFYLNGTWMPSVFWMHDWTNNAWFVRPAVDYNYNANWSCTLGAMFLGGNNKGAGFEVFDNKDYMFFKVTYKFN